MKNLRRSTLVGFAALVAVVLILVGLPAVAQDDTPACEGEYLEHVRELGLTYIGALNAQDFDSWYNVLADDYVQSAVDAGFAPLNRDEAMASAEGLVAAFPDLVTEIVMSTVSADCRFVTFRWTSVGTFVGNGNTGAPVPGMTMVEVEDGQILNEWIYYDLYALYTIMGLIPEPTATEGG